MCDFITSFALFPGSGRRASTGLWEFIASTTSFIVLMKAMVASQPMNRGAPSLRYDSIALRTVLPKNWKKDEDELSLISTEIRKSLNIN